MKNLDLIAKPEFQDGDVKSSLTFYSPAEGENKEIVMELKDGKFYFNGESVEDVHNVYERFNEWLSRAEKETN